MQPHADPTNDTTERFTVPEAATILGITAEAVRQRIRWGTLPIEKDEAGSVFVFLGPRKHNPHRQPHTDPTQPHVDPMADDTVLYEHMSSEIDYLRSQLDKERESSAELRRIIAALTQRIPELEAPASPEAPRSARESPVSGEGVQGNGSVPPAPGQ